jgi:hypothetical protein
VNEQHAKIMQELKPKPTIILKSKSLAKKRPNYALPAHQRLYRSFKTNTSNRDKNNSLNNLKRSLIKNAQPVEFSVYKDALRRQSKHRENPPVSTVKITNPESEKQIAQKLHRQMELICKERKIKTNNVSYNEVRTILNDAGFINFSKKTSIIGNFDNEEEDALIKDMWDYLNINMKENVTVQSIEAFLDGVLNVKSLSKINFILPKNIKTKYQRFNVNRVSSMFNKKPTNQKVNFNPVINPTSYRLAKNRKIKQSLLGSDEKNCSRKELEDLSNVANREQLECTFTPQVNNYSHKINSASYQKDRCLDLFNQAKSADKRFDKSTEEVEYEKSKQELTFAPSVSRKIKQSSSVASITPIINSPNENKEEELEEIKDIQITVQSNEESSPIVPTMRRKYMRVDTIKEESDSKEASTLKLDTTPFVAIDGNKQSKNPILIIDVNIGPDQVDKIVVNEGDKAEALCKKFVAKHGI